jgi:ribosome-binding protein aMBF1 (putative translation factor)
MSRYYKKPIPGRAHKPFSLEMVEVKPDDIVRWNLKKVVYWHKQQYALFINDNNEEIMQSLQAIRFIRCKPGEDNCNAKLTNAEGIEIFQRAINGESIKVLAKEFNVSEKTIRDIDSISTRANITLEFINNSINGIDNKIEQTKGIIAKRNKGKKLSSSLASFIRRDRKNLLLTTKQLAKKYCVSTRTIQRILKGDMYK